jgi:hypothetical protein
MARVLPDLLLASSQGRHFADSDGGRLRIWADDLRETLLAADVNPYGLRITGADVQGALDLSATQLGYPIEFRDCHFDKPINMDGMRVHALYFVDRTVLPAITANGLDVARDLLLSETALYGAVSSLGSRSQDASLWLNEARIGGRFIVDHCAFMSETGRAIQADRSSIGGNVRLINGVVSHGELRFIGATIGGSLDLVDATLLPHDGRALDIASARIDGSLFIIDSGSFQASKGKNTIRGRIEAGNATIGGRVSLRNCLIVSPNDRLRSWHYCLPAGAEEATAIYAPRIAVSGDVSFEGETEIQGGIDFRSATIGASLNFDGQRLSNPSDVALYIEHATIGGDLRAVRCTFSGSFNARSSRIEGDFDLSGTSFRECLGDALDASHARVTGNVRLSASRTTGSRPFFANSAIRLLGARIGGNLNFWGAEVGSGTDNAIVADRVDVGDSVFLRFDKNGEFPFVAHGCVRMPLANVAGSVDARGADLRCEAVENPVPSDGEHQRATTAINASGATIRGSLLLSEDDGRWASIAGSLRICDAQLHGGVSLEGARFVHAGELRALDAQGLQAGSLELGKAQFEPSAAISLQDSNLSGPIAFNGATWPDAIDMDGAVYRRFGSTTSTLTHVDEGLDILSRQIGGFRPGPYSQLAAVLRSEGLVTAANDVLVCRERMRSRSLTQPGRILYHAWGLLSGYGYRPWRTVWALLLLIVAGGVVFAFAPVSRLAVCQGDELVFLSGVYAADLAVPLIDLKLASCYRPSSVVGQLWMWANIGLGWFFSGAFVLAVSGLFRPPD